MTWLQCLVLLHAHVRAGLPPGTPSITGWVPAYADDQPFDIFWLLLAQAHAITGIQNANNERVKGKLDFQPGLATRMPKLTKPAEVRLALMLRHAASQANTTESTQLTVCR